MREQSGAKAPRPALESGDFSPGSESSRSAGPEADVDSAIEVEPELDPEDAPSEVDSGPPSIPSAASVGSSETASSTPAGLFTGVLPGHVIANRYEVLGVLGEGGMGIVHRCRDQTTNQGVAIKRVIVPDGKLAAEYVMWFYKEARSTTRASCARATSAASWTARRIWPWIWPPASPCTTSRKRA